VLERKHNRPDLLKPKLVGDQQRCGLTKPANPDKLLDRPPDCVRLAESKPVSKSKIHLKNDELGT